MSYEALYARAKKDRQTTGKETKPAGETQAPAKSKRPKK